MRGLVCCLFGEVWPAPLDGTNDAHLKYIEYPFFEINLLKNKSILKTVKKSPQNWICYC
jgi:hypothetical protein